MPVMPLRNSPEIGSVFQHEAKEALMVAEKVVGKVVGKVAEN